MSAFVDCFKLARAVCSVVTVLKSCRNEANKCVRFVVLDFYMFLFIILDGEMNDN